MKIIITGSSGMLGGALCRELSGKYELFGMDISNPTTYVLPLASFIECDITDRKKTITKIVSVKPDIVIHAAGYTDVDGCEVNEEKARQVNALGTKAIALACRELKTFLCYISTDFVFDGEKKSPYVESDNPKPINVYGKSKAEGEEYVHSILENFLIVRSSWLFGKGGKNFVDTILSKAKSKEKISVVGDQSGSPTYTEDLAQGIGKLIGLRDKAKGIFHITNSGSCSWYELACAIKEIAKLETDILEVSSEKYPTAVKRPKMSILDNRRYQELFGEKLPLWEDALKEYLSE